MKVINLLKWLCCFVFACSLTVGSAYAYWCFSESNDIEPVDCDIVVDDNWEFEED